MCSLLREYIYSIRIYITSIYMKIYILYPSCQLFSLSRTSNLGDKRLGTHITEELTAPMVLIMWGSVAEHAPQLQNIWADFPNSDARESFLMTKPSAQGLDT